MSFQSVTGACIISGKSDNSLYLIVPIILDLYHRYAKHLHPCTNHDLVARTLDCGALDSEKCFKLTSFWF